MNNGYNYVFIATVVFLLAIFSAESIAKQTKFFQKAPVRVYRRDKEDEFRSINAINYYKKKATLV
jgi:hypothetical protein